MTPAELENATRLSMVSKTFESQGVTPVRAQQLTTILGSAFVLGAGPAGLRLETATGNDPVEFAKTILATDEYRHFLAPLPGSPGGAKVEPSDEQKEAELRRRALAFAGLSSAATGSYVPLGR